MCGCCALFSRTSEEQAFRAAKNGDLADLTRILTKNRAFVRAKDGNRQTLLHVAVAINNVSIAKYLTETGVSLDQQDENKNTALHLAVATGSSALVELLLENEANISLQNDSDETAFQMAVRRNKYTLQELLKNFNEREKQRYALLRYGTTDVGSEAKILLDQMFKKNLEGGTVGVSLLRYATDHAYYSSNQV